MPDYFKTDLDNEKTLENLELIDKIMSIQTHLMDCLEAERNAPAAYIHGYCKAILDFSTLSGSGSLALKGTVNIIGNSSILGMLAIGNITNSSKIVLDGNAGTLYHTNYYDSGATSGFVIDATGKIYFGKMFPVKQFRAVTPASWNPRRRNPPHRRARMCFPQRKQRGSPQRKRARLCFPQRVRPARRKRRNRFPPPSPCRRPQRRAARTRRRARAASSCGSESARRRRQAG